MVGEDLQFLAEVDLAYVDALRHHEDRRCKVQDAGDPEVDEPVGDGLRGIGGSRDDSDHGAGLCHHVFEFAEVGDGETVNALAHQIGRGVDQADDPKPVRVEAGVVSQRRTEIAQARR